MRIVAIDPGTNQSGYVDYADGAILSSGVRANDYMHDMLMQSDPQTHTVVIEWPAGMGMLASRDLLDTAAWAGAFAVAAGFTPATCNRITRGEVLAELLPGAKPKGVSQDSRVRAVLLDLYGGAEVALFNGKCDECKARGKIGLGKARRDCEACGGTGKVKAGPLVGVSSHAWPALAVAVVWERKAAKEGAK